MGNEAEKQVEVDPTGFWCVTSVGDHEPKSRTDFEYSVETMDDYCKNVHRRTWGVFPNRELAERIPQKNLGALEEAGYYKWLAVEKFEWGLYPGVLERYFYEWDRSSDRWVPIEDLPDNLQPMRGPFQWCSALG